MCTNYRSVKWDLGLEVAKLSIVRTECWDARFRFVISDLLFQITEHCH